MHTHTLAPVTTHVGHMTADPRLSHVVAAVRCPFPFPFPFLFPPVLSMLLSAFLDASLVFLFGSIVRRERGENFSLVVRSPAAEPVLFLLSLLTLWTLAHKHTHAQSRDKTKQTTTMIDDVQQRPETTTTHTHTHTQTPTQHKHNQSRVQMQDS